MAFVTGNFRSEFAAASLKLDVGLGVRFRGRNFRSEFAAASLKHSALASPSTTVGPFPQRIRCGLIEAVIWGCIFLTLQRYFRSEFAAASLKQQVRLGRPHSAHLISAANSLRPH